MSKKLSDVFKDLKSKSGDAGSNVRDSAKHMATFGRIDPLLNLQMKHRNTRIAGKKKRYDKATIGSDDYTALVIKQKKAAAKEKAADERARTKSMRSSKGQKKDIGLLERGAVRSIINANKAAYISRNIFSVRT
jgi:hypothetical protein